MEAFFIEEQLMNNSSILMYIDQSNIFFYTISKKWFEFIFDKSNNFSLFLFLFLNFLSIAFDYSQMKSD